MPRIFLKTYYVNHFIPVHWGVGVLIGPHRAVVRDYSWVSTQESLVAGRSQDHMECQVCCILASALPAVLSQALHLGCMFVNYLSLEANLSCTP